MTDGLEFSAKRFQLEALTGWAAGVVPAGATLPVNRAFRLTVSPELLRVTATDRLRTVVAETPSVVAQAPGTVFLPARKLTAILAAAPDGDVTVSVKADIATVRAGSASWQLKLPPAEEGAIELPDLSAAEFQPVGREKLLTALNTVKYAVGRGDGRPAFAKVQIAEHGGAMYATAVGSSLLARARVDGFPFPVQVPGIILPDLVKLLTTSADKTVGVADAGTCVAFRTGPVTMAAQYTGQDFPDVDGMFFRKVSGNELTLDADRSQLTRALKGVRINADTTTSAVGLIADCVDGKGQLTVLARDTGGNSAEQVIEAAWTGKRQLLVVSGTFLEHMLASHPGAMATFRVAADHGSQRAPLLLEDTTAGVAGICTQMPAGQVGY
jgi:DNA polymerase III sliding clamp (beta) subunit (PCNA family)